MLPTELAQLDVGRMVELARDFAAVLDEKREVAARPGLRWYPFPMLPAMVENLDQLLTGPNRRLLALAEGGAIADIGGADGDFAYFLESLGCDVDLIDHAPTQWTGLEPAYALKDALGSRVHIHDIDVDQPFELPREYRLVFLMGILYHLKNPFQTLENLALQCSHCVLSTKVARYTGVPRLGRPHGARVQDVPVAYLLDDLECNYDPTNYWVFSEAGLRRILERTGWTILDYTTAGNRRNPTPSHVAEERAWCLLRSERYPDA